MATQVAMMKQPEEPAPEEEGDEEVPAGLDDLLGDIRGEGEPEQKKAEDFPTIDDKIAEKDEELDDLDDDEAFEYEYDKVSS